LQNLPKNERAECLLALCEVPESFGRPHVHVHTGLGIRKLGDKIFECRGSASLRFIFQDRPAELFVSFLGNHDEVKALLQTRKYR
jgi:midasin (ATPase involved in ribosome maturation)